MQDQIFESMDTLARKIHAHNKEVGWWDDNLDPLIKVQLVSSEVAEATEGERKDIMDTHLPNRKMGEVELADALIRTLDLGGKFNYSFDMKAKPHGEMVDLVNGSNNKPHPLIMHFWINSDIVVFGRCLAQKYEHKIMQKKYSQLVASIQYACQHLGYDLIGAALEKIEYNKHRADHKRENRAKAGGKKD